MLKFDLRWVDIIRYLLQILLALFLVVADLNAVVAATTGAGEITFYQTEATHVAQADDIGFTARAPPFAVSNVAVTGGVTAMHGSAFSLHGQETVAALFGFERSSIAPNKGRLTGNPARTTSSDPEAIRGIARENEAAQNLANNGFDVVQNPGTLPNGKTPDLRLNGEIYDVVSPSSNRVRNIGSRIEGKVESGQTQNVVVNLADTTVTPSQLTQQLRDYPVSGLQGVVIIDRSGSVLPPVRFD